MRVVAVAIDHAKRVQDDGPVEEAFTRFHLWALDDLVELFPRPTLTVLVVWPLIAHRARDQDVAGMVCAEPGRELRKGVRQ